MNTSRYVLAATLLVLSTAGMIVYGQGEKITPRAAGVTTKVDVFTGKATNGLFQDALNEAVNLAQAAANKGGADMQVNWQLDTVTGTAGGITGMRPISVQIHVVK